MRLGQTIVAVAAYAFLAGAARADSAASASSALALAALVGENSPAVAAGDKHALAELLSGKPNINYPAGKKIAVSADSVVCRISNAQIVQRSCELKFGATTIKLTGRKANELFATIAVAGVAPDGAAGTIYEGVSQLACTIDPNGIKDGAGEGADCQFKPGAV